MRRALNAIPLFRRFAVAPRGNVAIIVAAVLPLLAVCAAGGCELAFLMADRSKMQDAADAAALSSAGQLAFGSEAAVLARAKTHAEVLTGPIARRATLIITADTLKQDGASVGVRVSIDSTRPSFFGNLLPPGGFKTRVSASAMGMGKANLCVFGTSESVRDSVNVERGAVTATGCVVHSNSDVRVNAGSTVAAATVQAAGAVTGAGAPNSRDGAETIEDPFRTLMTQPPVWGACTGSNNLKMDQEGQQQWLQAGVHCGHIDLDKNAVLKLNPGVHYFRNKLQMKDRSRLEAPGGATLVFGPSFDLEVDSSNVRWNLYGHKGGTGQAGDAFAGFTLVLDRLRSRELKIPAVVAERLEGVVYAPNARLIIDGAANAAEDSAWTVLVGKELRLTNNANVVLNTDYASSTVPLPNGVGNKSDLAQGANRLVQ